MCLFRKFLLVSILFFPLSLYSLNSNAGEICNSFTVNGDSNWYPFAYRTADNKLIGTVPDAAHLALSRIGLKMDVQQDRPWKRILYDLEFGNIDIVLGAYWNADRAKKYHFSELLGTDEIRVFVKKGNEFALKSFKDLIGKQGLILLGGSHGDEFDRFATKYLNFNEIPKNYQIIKMLSWGRADFGILGYIEGLQHIRDLGIEDQVVALPWPILSNGIYLMMNRSAPCAHRIKDLNASIQELQKNGDLDQIFSEYLERDVNTPE